ncbi:MAG: alpha-amylase family glycosyl hydrolase [Candidatus Enterosoma sp.]|nr:alpha-amylase family glycosyl hydrolase [bacterium]MDY5865778.1 alpha-amylase family glycosyl hydrolase [Candidatus Enterosoma sp.]
MSIFLNDIIYQIYVRDYTEEGTLSALCERLDYIKSLDVSIIQLLPIHPIGKLDKLGTYGSPYSISDYEKINPDFGNISDLKKLIKECHRRGLKLVLDVVINHTSKDAKLLKNHPEYYLKKDGKITRKFEAFTDVLDLDYHSEDLQKYMIDMLKRYLSFGVDGFRFDVCSLLDKDFLKRALTELKKEKEDVVLIGEAVNSSFIEYVRSINYHCYSNQEMFQCGFDALYHYVSFDPLLKFFETKKIEDLLKYKGALNVENYTICEEGFIIRSIENHDQRRIASLSDVDSFIKSVFSFSLFTRGPGFIYNGEECKNSKRLNFFEKEDIDFTIHDKNYSDFVMKNIRLKRRESNKDLHLSMIVDSNKKTLAIKNLYNDGHYEIGIFNFEEKECRVTVNIDDGEYIDLLTDKHYMIKKHSFTINDPVILVKVN